MLQFAVCTLDYGSVLVSLLQIKPYAACERKEEEMAVSIRIIEKIYLNIH